MNDEFEKKLRQQSLRPIPQEWREGILRTARTAAPRLSLADPPASWFSKLLWPCPQAWATLAAAWVAIIVLNYSTRDTSSAIAVSQATPPPPQLVEAAREQRLEMARLLEPSDVGVADRPKTSPARPRSDRRAEILNA
jgi:hypothetical protein